MPELVPQSAIPYVVTGDDDGIRRAKRRIIITPQMLISSQRDYGALFEGVHNGIRCRVSPLFSSTGSRLIAYQIEEGGGKNPGDLILPEDLEPIEAPRRTAAATATKAP